MGSTRIATTRLGLTICPTVWADPVNVWADASKVALICESDESLDIDGSHSYVRTWTLEVAGVQSTDPTSLWSILADAARTGEHLVFTYAPHGNPTPSVSQPHFTGTAQAPAQPSLGGEAAVVGDHPFEMVLDLIGEPTKLTS